jgi:hypothetical protein
LLYNVNVSANNMNTIAFHHFHSHTPTHTHTHSHTQSPTHTHKTHTQNNALPKHPAEKRSHTKDWHREKLTGSSRVAGPGLAHYPIINNILSKLPTLQVIYKFILPIYIYTRKCLFTSITLIIFMVNTAFTKMSKLRTDIR